MYVQVFGNADYVADQFSMREVPDIVNWRSEAETRIERLRKADFSFRYRNLIICFVILYVSICYK